MTIEQWQGAERLPIMAERLTTRTGTPHFVWLVPALGKRAASTVVLPTVYAGADWVQVAS